MKKSIFFKCFFIFIVLLNLTITTVSASPMTDLGNLGGMFQFSDGNFDSNFADNSMHFIASNDTGEEDFWNEIYGEYKGLITGVSGFCFITFAALFIMNFMKLGTTAGNPQARKSATITLLWTGLAAAACGMVSLFVGFSMNLFA